MALARCLSINFSSISSNCFSALSCLSGLLGGCLKPRKPSDIASESPSQSILGDDGSGGVGNSTTSPISTLLEPRSFVMPIQDPENQDLGPIKIKSVSVSVPQNGDLRNVPDEYILQNLNTYNAPVRINEENNGQAIEIQSIFNNLVQKDDEKMSKLATSHMDEFSKLMLSVEANASYEPKLQIPMRQVDESDLNYDQGLKYTSLNKESLATGVFFSMPIPIREEALNQDSGVPINSSFPKVLQVNLVQPIFEEIPFKQEKLLSSSGKFSVDYSFDEEPLNDWGGGKSRGDNFNKDEQNIDQPKRVISDTELGDFIDAYEEGKTKQPKPTIRSSEINEATWYEMFSPEKLGEFFGNSSEKVSSHDFFEKLSDFVNKIKEKVVPSPAPASARVESDSRNGKGK